MREMVLLDLACSLPIAATTPTGQAGVANDRRCDNDGKRLEVLQSLLRAHAVGLRGELCTGDHSPAVAHPEFPGSEQSDDHEPVIGPGACFGHSS